jgi:HD superfamily phosphodiesterase
VRVVGWLLELCPPEYRGHDVLRRHPVVLARLAALHAEATLGAARTAYAGARRDLAERVPPEAIEETLAALSKEGALLAARVREAGLVEEALAGRRWRPKL